MKQLMNGCITDLCVDKWDTDPVVAVQLAQVIAVRHHLLQHNTACYIHAGRHSHTHTHHAPIVGSRYLAVRVSYC